MIANCRGWRVSLHQLQMAILLMWFGYDHVIGDGETFNISTGGRTMTAAHADLCRDFFSRAVTLELSFFEAAYAT